MRITVRELIEMLEKWDQDMVFDVHIQNDPKGSPESIVVSEPISDKKINPLRSTTIIRNKQY